MAASSSSDDKLSDKLSDKVKAGLAVLGIAGAGLLLYKAFFSGSPSSGTFKLGGTEVHLKFQVTRSVADAQHPDTKTPDQAFEWDIVLGTDYFYHNRPMRDGNRVTRVYFFGGEHNHEIASYFEKTHNEILKQYGIDPEPFNAVPALHAMLESWAPLEKQSYTGYIDKDQQIFEQLPGNLFGGQIECSVYDSTTQRSSSGSEPPIPRPSHGVSYQWSRSGEEVVDCTPPSAEEVAQFRQLGCFSAAHLAMLDKALIWLLRIHPEILRDIQERAQGFPPTELWYRHLHDSETVYERITLVSVDTQNSGAHFIPPASISTYQLVVGNTPDPRWNQWIDAKFVHWEPAPIFVAAEALERVLERAFALKTDEACFDALLALQEHTLQFPVDPKVSLGHINSIAEIAQSDARQFSMTLQYLTAVSQMLMGNAASLQMQHQINAIFQSLIAQAPSTRTPILRYWQASIRPPQHAIDLLESLLDYNPYLISIWIELATQFGEVQEIEKAWLCRAIASRLNPSLDHPSFENSYKQLEIIIRSQLAQFL